MIRRPCGPTGYALNVTASHLSSGEKAKVVTGTYPGPPRMIWFRSISRIGLGGGALINQAANTTISAIGAAVRFIADFVVARLKTERKASGVGAT